MCHGVYHQKPHRQLTGGNSYQKMADGRGDLTRGRAAAEGRRRRKGEVRLDRGAAVVKWRAECWEMLKVLQPNMHLRIWGMKMQELWTSISKYEVYKGVIFRYTYIYPASCSPQSQFASLCVSHLSPSSASGVFFSPSHLKV